MSIPRRGLTEGHPCIGSLQEVSIVETPRRIEHANFEDTGYSHTLSLINGKYKMVILYTLMDTSLCVSMKCGGICKRSPTRR